MRKKITSLILTFALLLTSTAVPMQQIKAENTLTENDLLAENNKEVTNVAKGKNVQVSSVEDAVPQNIGANAVDGKQETRWSCNAMKNQGATDETEQTPQWLIIDLGATKTNVDNMKIHFFNKVWASKYRIETADTKDGNNWETVKTFERASGSLNDNPVDEVTNINPLKRYVRFYFEKVNVQAGGTSVSVKEIEINGTQDGETPNPPTPPTPPTPQPQGPLNYAKDFNDNNVSSFSILYGSGANITANDKKMQLTYGTARAGVVDKTIAHRVADGTFEATVTPKQDGKRFGLIMRATDENNKVYVGCEENGSKWFWEYWNGSNKSTWGSLHNGPALENGKPAKIKVKLLGDTVTLWVNDTQVFSEKMSGNPLLSEGYFGFDKSREAGQFLIDDVKFTEITDSASKVMSKITALQPVTAQDKNIVLPQVPQGYEIAVVGSEKEQIVSNTGKITAHNIGDKTFSVIVEVRSKTDKADKVRKNFDITVPSKNSLYPNLYPTVQNQNKKPRVIPALQEWYGYNGEFKLDKSSKIVVNDLAKKDLMKVASNMQKDLEEITGKKLNIVTGGADTAKANDIYIESQKDDVYETGKEGYFMTVDNKGVKIYSSTYQGALYGTITVEQMLWQDKENDSIPKGVIRDYPDYEIRGIMLDVARIPHRLKYLQDYTKILTWYKMNEFQLHLNDDFDYDPNGLPNQKPVWDGMHRLESNAFPSLSKNRVYKGERFEYFNKEYSDPEYSKNDYRELEKMAKDGAINLVPEFDTPSHSHAYVKYAKENPDKLNWIGEIHSKNSHQMLALDVNDKDQKEKQKALNARKFIETLYGDYLSGNNPVFTGDYVNVGADEYWDKSNPEAYRNYVIFLNDLMKKYNKTTRMWGAMKLFPGKTEIPTENIILDVWSTYEDDPIARMNEGFRVVNVPQPYLYSTPGRDHKDMIVEEWLYKHWDPVIFNGNIVAQKGEPLLLGAKAAVWGDEFREGITEADLHERELRSVAMVAEKTWGGTAKEDNYIEYQKAFNKLKEGPSTTIANDIDSKTDVVADYDLSQAKTDKGNITVKDSSRNGYDAEVKNGKLVKVDGKDMIEFNGKTLMTTPLKTLSYPYTLSFDVKAGEGNTSKSLLFSGYDGQLLSDGFNNTLSLNRSFFHQSFGYAIPKDKTVNITLVGTFQNTKLYVDGKLVKMLYSSDTGKSDEYFTTFVFPMETIGKDFHGYIGNIKAYNKAIQPDVLKANSSEITEVNIALNKDAYTERFGNQPDLNTGLLKRHQEWKATDGDKVDLKEQILSTDPNSYWISSNNDLDYLMVDLGRESDVSKVVVNWEGNRFATNFDIQTSLDGNQWTKVGGQTNNTNTVSTITLANPVKARYVKMQGVKRATDYYAIRELEVYEKVDKGALKTLLQEVNKVIESASNQKDLEKLKAEAHLATRTLENKTATQDVINQAYQSLDSVFKAYKEENPQPEKPTVVVDKLKEILAEAEKVDTTGATEQTKEKFDVAVSKAKEVLQKAENGDKEITQEVVDKAYKDVSDAIKGLEFKPAPPVEDNKAPTAPEDLKVSDIGTTSAKLSWNASKDDVGVAGYDILLNGEVIGQIKPKDTSSKVEAILNKLKPNTEYTVSVLAFDKALNKSEKVSLKFTTLKEETANVDKSKLQELYNKYKDTQNKNYTDNSWKSFEDALANAKAVLDKNTATKEDVNNAIDLLTKAFDSLTQKGSAQSNMAQTMDNNMISLLASIMSVSAVSILGIFGVKKRRKNK